MRLISKVCVLRTFQLQQLAITVYICICRVRGLWTDSQHSFHHILSVHAAFALCSMCRFLFSSSLFIFSHVILTVCVCVCTRVYSTFEYIHNKCTSSAACSVQDRLKGKLSERIFRSFHEMLLHPLGIHHVKRFQQSRNTVRLTHCTPRSRCFSCALSWNL